MAYIVQFAQPLKMQIIPGISELEIVKAICDVTAIPAPVVPQGQAAPHPLSASALELTMTSFQCAGHAGWVNVATLPISFNKFVVPAKSISSMHTQ